VSNLTRLPSIRQLLLDAEATNAQIIGAPYTQWNCWHLVRYLLQAGLGINLDADPRHNMDLVAEYWWHEDTADPLTCTQPWDLWVFRLRGVAAEHLGVVMDSVHMVHTNETHGVTIETLKRWRPHLLLIYRLRQLL
jgi:cell wall-associated NlpC family hydrolase